MNPPYEKYPQLLSLFERLKEQKEKCPSVGMELVTPPCAIYPIHMFLFPLINRTMNLLDGILDSFEKWNIAVSGTLLRNLQENLFLLVYISTKKNPEEIVKKFLENGRIVEFRNRKWKNVPESEIIKHCEKYFPFKDIYEDLCELNHFSKKHFHMTFGRTFKMKGKFSTIIGIGDQGWTEEEMKVFLEGSIAMTDLIFRYMQKYSKIFKSQKRRV